MDFIKDKEGALLMDDVARFEFSDTFCRTYLVSARAKNMHIFDFGFEEEDFVHARKNISISFFPAPMTYTTSLPLLRPDDRPHDHQLPNFQRRRHTNDRHENA